MSDITEDEFQEILELYISQFGHTFTVFGLTPEKPEFEIAYTEMLQCLNGDRTEPVTDESIGKQGEGVRENEAGNLEA
jgi:hypothetical protein